MKPRVHRQKAQSDRPSPSEGTEQLIQERAYALYLGRDMAPGHELDDWLQAEREVQSGLEAEEAEPAEAKHG